MTRGAPRSLLKPQITSWHTPSSYQFTAVLGWEVVATTCQGWLAQLRKVLCGHLTVLLPARR